MAFKVTLRKSERSPVWSRVSGNYRVFRSSGFLRVQQNSGKIVSPVCSEDKKRDSFWEEGSTLNVVARVSMESASSGNVSCAVSAPLCIASSAFCLLPAPPGIYKL